MATYRLLADSPHFLGGPGGLIRLANVKIIDSKIMAVTY